METEKEKLRKKLLKQRKNIDEQKVTNISYIIKDTLLKKKEFKKAEKIMSYISYRNEVNTYPLNKSLLDSGKQVFLPYCIKDKKRIEITPVYDLKNDLVEGSYGIKEPAPELRQHYSPEALDIIVVPAVAFSQKGYRIGYGGGYYDRFLPQLPERTISFGLTYDKLLLPELPKESHDIPVDYVVTEKQIINTNKIE